MPQVFICFSIYIGYRLIVQLKTLKNFMKLPLLDYDIQDNDYMEAPWDQ